LHTISTTNQRLELLSISDDIFVPFDFSTGLEAIDSRRIMVEKAGVVDGNMLLLCHPCHKAITSRQVPEHSLSNFRWVGHQPEELRDLTWLEELLVARAHLVGRVVKLEERKASSYFALKGHTLLLPQDTTLLLDLLPMPLSSLPDIVRVVWAGRETSNMNGLRSHFTVRTAKVYNALLWLCNHHEDYRHIQIDEDRLAAWSSTEVTMDLMNSMVSVSDPSTEDASRTGFATENPDSIEIHGDIPLTASGMVDVNNVTISPHTRTLLRAAELRQQTSAVKPNVTVNVVTGSTILNDRSDPTYFTSAFPTLFPYGCGKHLDKRRSRELSFQAWIQLLLRHASRYDPSYQVWCSLL